ncbi:MAG: hypothetical protein Q4G47_08355, partial [Lachnospiraceae bacterium]|nr:hypothetical protein [Lachnospiraceae bacterium]
MSLKHDVYEAYKRHILDHTEENRSGALAMRESLEHSPLWWNGIVEKTVHIPKIYDEEDIGRFGRIASVTHRIFEKVIREYREHEDFRRLYSFPKELEELILLPVPYEGYLPIARFDLFLNEDTGQFRFCEINTDGTAAMLRDLELRRQLINNPAHQAVIRRYHLEPFELFDTW